VYTLINRTGNLCTGLFPTLDMADYWANTFLPELGLKSIELLTDKATEEVVKEDGGWTWGPDSIDNLCSGPTNLPTC
jgi:hypothetical protein